MPSITEQLFDQTKQYFVDLGYNELDCLVYILALQYGPVSMVTLARLANKARSTMYESIKRLVAKGLILEQPQRSTTLYVSISIEQLIASIENQSNTISTIATNIGKHKDVFEGLKQGNTSMPIVTFYGAAEITSVMWKKIKKSSFVRSIRDIDWCMTYFDINIAQATKLANTSSGLTHRILIDSPSARAYKKKHQSKNYKIKLYNDKAFAQADVMIMDGSYFHTSYDKTLVGIQIHDDKFYKMQTVFFDTLRSQLS